MRTISLLTLLVHTSNFLVQAKATSSAEQDLYLRVKAAEKQLEYLSIQVGPQIALHSGPQRVN